MESNKFTVEELNAWECEEFTEHLSQLFERTPLIAAAVWSKRPFSATSDLHRACCSVVDELGQLGQIGLLRCYPDLAGGLAIQGQLSQASREEHSSAGLLSLSQEEFRRMSEQNKQYKNKFGFPFVLCVRENKKEAILEGFAKRLVHSRDEEVAIAINEVKKIAWYRLQDLIVTSSKI